MGNGAEDTLVELGNVIREWKALRDRDPEHELLKIATLHDDEGGMDWSAEVKMRYWPKNGRNIHFYWRYLVALQRAGHGKIVTTFTSDVPEGPQKRWAANMRRLGEVLHVALPRHDRIEIAAGICEELGGLRINYVEITAGEITADFRRHRTKDFAALMAFEQFIAVAHIPCGTEENAEGLFYDPRGFAEWRMMDALGESVLANTKSEWLINEKRHA